MKCCLFFSMYFQLVFKSNFWFFLSKLCFRQGLKSSKIKDSDIDCKIRFTSYELFFTSSSNTADAYEETKFLKFFFLQLPSQNNIELKFTQTIFSPTAPNFENISLFAKLQFITYRRESWGPDLDRLRSGGEPPLLAGWPWYQEAVGLSDEDRDTESVRERIKNELNSKSKRMHFNNVV